MTTPTIEQVAVFVDIGLRLLAARLLLLLSMMMTFGLFCWAMHSETWISYTTALTFGVITFIPALQQAGKGGHNA